MVPLGPVATAKGLQAAWGARLLLFHPTLRRPLLVTDFLPKYSRTPPVPYLSSLPTRRPKILSIAPRRIPQARPHSQHPLAVQLIPALNRHQIAIAPHRTADRSAQSKLGELSSDVRQKLHVIGVSRLPLLPSLSPLRLSAQPWEVSENIGFNVQFALLARRKPHPTSFCRCTDICLLNNRVRAQHRPIRSAN